VIERAVARGQRAKGSRVPTLMGVDEKAIAKGHRYLTLVGDLQAGTVEYLSDDRNQDSLDGYFETLTAAQRAAIWAIAMDMWEPYIQSVLTHVPDGATQIVFDRYHIMTHRGKAVDDVRKREHRALQAEGDDTLTGSKY
jgi:transposase